MRISLESAIRFPTLRTSGDIQRKYGGCLVPLTHGGENSSMSPCSLMGNEDPSSNGPQNL